MRSNNFIPIILLTIIMVVSACAESQSGIPQEYVEQVKTIGEPAATTLAQGLAERVMAALGQGSAAAMDFCATEAQPLTREIQRELGRGLAVKRTSFQYRNPQNAPDMYEAMALRYFQDKLTEEGKLPEYYIQLVNHNEYRYYKPLVVADWCLQCHGDPTQFDPAVQQKLSELYPNDKAVGYAEGDFRGVVRVSIPTTQNQ